ncbi:MAG: cation diffusion facilitator family transporter [Chloroflexi bacterium]|nr:cation diffusion facilitator family transporter [Chloroflexota bacterium]
MNDSKPADGRSSSPHSHRDDEPGTSQELEHAPHSAEDTNSAAASERSARVNRRPLVIALGITTTFFVVELVGAYISNSLALLADAAHMLTDVAAIGLALFAMWLASRPASAERTFGYLRAEILAALVNAVTLIVLAIYIFWEAGRRLQEPPEVESGPLLVVAIAGMLANIAAAWVLSRGGGHRDNLNTRGAFLHVLGDLMGSVATIAAALVIAFTDWYIADPILSVLIGGLVVFGAWSLLRESVDVLLEAAPRGVSVADVRQAMRAMPGVDGVHDLHVWTVTSGLTALSAHVETASFADWEQRMKALAAMLREKFGIAHVTLQPEPPRSSRDDWDRCSIDAPEGHEACLTAANPVPRPVHAGHRH